MKVLVIAAHPDDEILGCGGTLLKHREQGDEIFVCIVTKAYAPRWTKEYMQQKLKEAEEVDKILGTKKRFYCGLPTMQLNVQPTIKINSAISSVVEEVGPDIIYTHHENDINKDHGCVFEAALTAARPIKNKIKICCFETLSSTEWNNKTFLPNYYVDIEEFIGQKVGAFCKYGSEVKKYPHPRSEEGIKILAQKRGMEICLKCAESFIIVRDCWVD